MMRDLNHSSGEAKPARRPLSPGGRVGVTLVSPLSARRVPLRGALTRQAAVSCINRLLFLAIQDEQHPILVEIDSQGGSLRESLWFIQTMDRVSCPVATFCSGTVAGTAVFIAAHGQRGCRVAAPETEFKFTASPAPAGNDGESDGQAQARQELVEVLARDTGRTPAEVAHWLEAGARFTAQEAVELGLIDCVSPKPFLAVGA